MRALLGLLRPAVLLLVLLASPDVARAQVAGSHVRRIAVLVGANQPPAGRSTLRFAHDDARRMAEVLQRVGRFAPADVHVLLEPMPHDLTRTLDDVGRIIQSAGAAETLFVFYYSGHSDGQSVYPHGEAVALAELRERITRIGARVRVGILDTCRGGSWTQAKGLSVGPPLDPVDLLTLTTEGTALLSSSSGLENAHEADAVKGSFFTHHLAAGLLGAADRSGDGSITLQEAFDYAKERTVRDSARMATTTQHPSYDVQLRGRQDIVLAQIAASSSALEVHQTVGPIEIIHLSSGLTVVEMPSGERTLRLALPPGRYVVRRVADGKTYAKEIEIPAGATAALAEGDLLITATDRLAMKGGDEKIPASLSTTLPRGTGELRLAGGVSTGTTYRWGPAVFDTGSRPDPQKASRDLERSFSSSFSLTAGITDRLQWAVPVPAFAYRFGNPGGLEVVPRMGLTSLGYSSVEGIIGTLDTGVALRGWAAHNRSFIATVGAFSNFTERTTKTQVASQHPTTWGMESTFGYAWTIQNTVTLDLAAGISGSVPLAGAQPHYLAQPSPLNGARLLFGSVQNIGYRTIPLLQFHVSPRFSIDGYASWSVNLLTGDVRDRYLAGFTWSF